MKLHTRILIAGAVLAALPFSCNKGASTPAVKTDLILFCGAGIRPAADSLIRAFEALHPVRIQTNYGGSGQQLGQLATTKKGDLFMPGDAYYADIAIERGLAEAATRTDLAYFIPVILVAKGNPRGVASMRDLLEPGLRLGLGDERACAVGKTTIEVLKKNAISYASIEKNVVLHAGTVNELGNAVKLNSVDAAIVWDVVAGYFRESAEIVPIPPEQNSHTTVPIVMLSSTKHPDEAKWFIAFAASPAGQAIFRAKGYRTSLSD